MRVESPPNRAHELSTVEGFLQHGFDSHVERFAWLQVRKAADKNHFGRVITQGQATICREVLEQ